MPKKIDLTQDLLKELIHYDSETGVFTWKHRDVKYFKNETAYKKWNTRFAGKTFGTKYTVSHNGKSYITGCILYKQIDLHRLAWIYVYGEMPNQVDHIDGDGTNNAISNLRNVTPSVNRKNTRRMSTNTSGFCGVSWRSKSKKWRARIMIGKKEIHLGIFDSFSEAVKAREEANIKYGFHVNHGMVRPL